RADGELRAPRGERRELEERRVAVEEQLDALARQQLLPLAVAAHVLLAAAGARERQLLLEQADLLEHRRVVHPVRLGAGVDARGEDGHQSWRVISEGSWPPPASSPRPRPRRCSPGASPRRRAPRDSPSSSPRRRRAARRWSPRTAAPRW